MWPDRRILVLSILIVIGSLVASVALYSTDDGGPSTETAPTTTRPRRTTTSPSTTNTTVRRTTTTAAPSTLVVSDAGWSLLESSGSYGAVLTNHDPSQAVVDVDIDVTFRDRNDTVVGFQSELVELLLPGQATAIGGPLQGLSRDTASIDIDIVSAEVVATDRPVGAITFDGVSFVVTDNGITTSGAVHSSFPITAERVTAVALYRDALARTVGADIAFLDPVPPGGSVSFAVEGTDPPPAVVSATPYASLPRELLGN